MQEEYPWFVPFPSQSMGVFYFQINLQGGGTKVVKIILEGRIHLAGNNAEIHPTPFFAIFVSFITKTKYNYYYYISVIFQLWLSVSFV